VRSFEFHGSRFEEARFASVQLPFDVTCSDSLPFLQVYEMYVTGYQFKVLSPVFTVHWGLQTRKSRPAWRERQNSANRKQFETFKKEVFARYMRDPLKMMKNAN